jgi:copper chaperone CopZ
MNKLQFTISGFHCESCIKLSTLKLKKIPGVTQVNMSGLDGKTEIQADRAVTLEEVREALKDTEYTVK